jgi:hypothetical protein
MLVRIFYDAILSTALFILDGWITFWISTVMHLPMNFVLLVCKNHKGFSQIY